MKVFFKFFAIFILIALMGGCVQKKPPIIPQLADLPTPYNLVVNMGDGKARLDWQYQGEIDAYVLGYNIYIADKPVADLPLAELPYPMIDWPPMYIESDTVNDWTHYDLEGLDNGKRYYVHVRLKGANSRVSLPSNEVMIIPRPEGIITLHETSSKNYSAFDFSEGKMVASKNKKSDFHFDVIDDQYRIRSPHLRKKGLRITGFILVDDESSSISENSDFFDEVTVAVGSELIVKLKEGNYAKLFVKNLGGKYPNTYVELHYIYQEIENVLEF